MNNKDSVKEKPGVEKGFSTLTFNLRFGLADDGENSWHHRKKAMPALFKKYRPDFIGLQEANDFQIDDLATILIGYEFIGKRSPAPPNWQNNGDHIDWILYRGHIAPVNYQVVVSTFEGVYPSDHFPVYAEFRWLDKC